MVVIWYRLSQTGSFVSWQAKYIASCLDEIKQELRQENAAVKANAVAKLTYVSRSIKEARNLKVFYRIYA